MNYKYFLTIINFPLKQVEMQKGRDGAMWDKNGKKSTMKRQEYHAHFLFNKILLYIIT